VACALHLGERRAEDARKGRVGTALHAQHPGHGLARWINAIDAAGAEQVAFADIGAAGHEAQFQAASVARHRITKGYAAHSGAHVLHGGCLLAVDQQRDFTHERQHARHLAEHARGIDDGRSRHHARGLAAVYDHAPAERVGRVVNHLGRLGGNGDALPQLQQLAQLLVFLQQQVRLVCALRELQHLGARGAGVGLGLVQRLEVVQPLAGELHGLAHQPLRRVEHRRHGLAQRAHELKARVSHHQEQRERSVQRQLRQRRGSLFEERGRAALQGCGRHGAVSEGGDQSAADGKV